MSRSTRIHVTEAGGIITSGMPFSVKIVKKNGTIVTMERVVFLSLHRRKRHYRVKLLDSKEIREFSEVQILSINHYEVFL